MDLATKTNLDFCRRYLQKVFEEVLAFEPKARARDAAVIKLRLGSVNQTYYFELPDRPQYRGHFSWTGDADNAFHAKAQGWSAWLSRHKGKDKT